MKFLSLSSILVLGLSLAVFSCQKQVPIDGSLNEVSSSFVSPRSVECGIASIYNEDDPEPNLPCTFFPGESLEIDMGNGCIATVVMDVLRCENAPTIKIFYFDEIQITIPPTCDIAILDPNFVENAYNNFIELFLENVVANDPNPNNYDCVFGEITFETTWMRMTCTMECVSFGEEGAATIQNVPCAMQQGCCRHEKSWCMHEGELLNMLDRKWVDGECAGFFSPKDCKSKKGCQEITCE